MNDLYATVIHEVKNQLAELAMRLGKRPDTSVEAAIALSASRRLSEILLLKREGEHALWANADSVNPGDFLAELAAEYREFHPGLDIGVDLSRAPVFAFFDEALVRMGLGCAVHNACRHAKRAVTLSAFETEGMLALEVADDGPGFPDEILDGAGRVPAPASGTGTGLGLYLAGRIAALHQAGGRSGRIELANAGGARFRMLLP